MSSLAYALPQRDKLLTHGRTTNFWFRDGDDTASKRRNPEIEAIAASGDAFELLASEIDRVMLTLEPNSNERLDLDAIVKVLLYLQEHHTIVRR